MSATYGWGSPDRKLGHVPRRYLRLHRSTETGEYLVLQPDETDEPFAVRLEANTYSIRWHSVVSRETKDVGTVEVEDGGNTTFAAPFAEAGPAVLHLKRDGN